MLNIQKNISLASLTTFKIGGNAKFYTEIKNKEDLLEAFAWVEQENEKYIILAGGSNVLINDQIINALVIKINFNDIKVKGDRLECGAGVSLSVAVNKATGDELTGLEWAIGIPGSVGGAIRGNAGAFGADISEYIETVEAFDVANKRFSIFSKRDCNFSYRGSIFKENNNLIIFKATLKLNKGILDDIKSKIEDNLTKRISSQSKLPSAGCVFKNLLVSNLEQSNPTIIQWAKEENVLRGDKIAAGWLIDKIGLRGKKMGDAKVSLEHANFIVNTGKATASEVIMLISYIKQQVRDRYKVQLQEEIVYLGF